MSRITLLIKPTHACNFSCVYCYNSRNLNNHNKLIDDRHLFKILRILAIQFDNINCIWLGGEPLLYGKERFLKVIELQQVLLKEYNTIFTNSLQTNTMLLDENYVELFKKNNFSIGMSYDGINTILTRGHGEDLWKKILELKEQKITNSVLYVLSSYNKKELLNDYEIFKKNNISFQINRFIPTDNTDEKLNISTEEYVDLMFDLFKKYCQDLKNGSNFFVQPFNEFINMVKNKKATSCHYGSCLYKYLCIDPNGDLYMCARHTQKICNIDAINNFEDIINSPSYLKIHSDIKEKRVQCKTCEFFYYCGGGCHFRSTLNSDYCEEFKLLFSKIKEYIDENI